MEHELEAFMQKSRGERVRKGWETRVVRQGKRRLGKEERVWVKERGRATTQGREIDE